MACELKVFSSASMLMDGGVLLTDDGVLIPPPALCLTTGESEAIFYALDGKLT